MKETYKIINGVYDRDVTTDLLNLRIDTNTRGQQNKIFMERLRFEVGKHSFFLLSDGSMEQSSKQFGLVDEKAGYIFVEIYYDGWFGCWSLMSWQHIRMDADL